MQVFAHGHNVYQQVFFFNDLDVFKGRSRGGKAAAEGADIAKVRELIGGVLQGRKYFFGGHGAGNGHIGAGDALGHGHNVGLDVEVLIAKPLARSAKTANHFVHNNQDAVFLANFSNGFIVAFRWHDNAAARRNGLQNNRAHSVWAFFLHYGFQLAGKLFAQVFRAFGIGRTVGQARRKFRKSGGEWPVLLTAFFLTAGAQGGDGCAVVIAVAVNNFIFFAAMLEMRNLAHHLEGLFIGLGTAAGNIHAGKTRHVRKQFFRKINGRLGSATGRIKRQFFHLFGGGIGNAVTAITHVDTPNAARGGVQIFFAINILEVQSLAFYRNHRGIALMQHKVMPYVFYIPADILIGILC